MSRRVNPQAAINRPINLTPAQLDTFHKNRRLVYWFINKFPGVVRDYPREDAEQEGLLVLARCIKHADEKKGKLSTLFRTSMRNRMANVRNKDHFFGDDRILNGQKVPKPKLKTIDWKRSDTDFNPQPGFEMDSRLIDNRGKHFTQEVDECLDAEVVRLALEWALDQLPPRQAFILRGHLIDGVTLEVIAEELGTTRENVRQIKERALNDLRVHMKCKLSKLSRQ